MAGVMLAGEKLAGMPEARAVRMKSPAGFHGSMYRVEVREAAPRFSRGDGKDEGRNILSAVLIGARWVGIGYVVGSRGDWFAYDRDPFNTTVKKRMPNGTVRRGKVYVPPLTGGRQRTVREAAWVVRNYVMGGF